MLAIFMPSWFGLRIYLLFSETDDYRCIPGYITVKHHGKTY